MKILRNLNVFINKKNLLYFFNNENIYDLNFVNFINKKDLLTLNKEINFLKTNNLIKRSKFAGRLILENVEINSILKILKK